jgi:predicted phosphohydrolase
MSLEFQVLSDLHLEVVDKIPTFPVTAENLILAGDIGYPLRSHYMTFIRDVASKYKHIYVVAGNHEFYDRSLSVQKMIASLHQFCSQFDNVHFLSNNCIVRDNVRIVGTILWTDIPEQYQKTVKESILDYKRITAQKSASERVPLKPENTVEWHREAVAFLEKEIKEAEKNGEKVLVITHHAPTFQAISKQYEGDVINFAYATNLEHLIKAPVVAWVFGHTHHPSRLVINGVQLVNNCGGYPGEIKSGFDPSYVLTI